MKQRPRVDYVGKIINGIEIIAWDEEKSMQPEEKHHSWKGRCLICNQIRSYKIDYLKKYKEEDCGNCEQVLMIGRKYHRLTVEKYLGKKIEKITKDGRIHTRNLFLCLCDCGNYIEVDEHKLKTGNTKSCGCLAYESWLEKIAKIHETQCKDLTGMRSGLLIIERLATPEEYIGRPKGPRYWYARCDCGNHHVVGTSDFLMGKVQSCGCMNSKGEAKITNILTEYNIAFLKQYTFEDLLGENNTHYSFDFAILTNNKLKYLIEYDGIQHFEEDKQFFEGAYEKILFRDARKNEYCIKNNIPLIRIPYTRFNELCIEDLLLETTQFLYKPNN